MNATKPEPSTEIEKPSTSKVIRIVERVPPAVWPGTFTTGSIFFAFLAISFAAKGNWHAASLCLLGSGIMDVLDGRIAKITHSETKFGILFDSMADLIAFGVAPAIVVMLWTYDTLGHLAIVTPFIYVFCTTIRLTIFSMNTEGENDYLGLPSPIAGLLITSFVSLMESPNFYALHEYNTALRAFISALSVVLGLLMISRIGFSRISFLRSPQPSPFFLVGWISCVAVIFTLIYINSSLAIFGMAVGYTLIGLVLGAFNYIAYKRKKLTQAKKEAKSSTPAK